MGAQGRWDEGNKEFISLWKEWIPWP
jgi:hypothetical protein